MVKNPLPQIKGRYRCGFWRENLRTWWSATTRMVTVTAAAVKAVAVATTEMSTETIALIGN